MIRSAFAALALLAFFLAPLGHTADSDTIAGKWHFVLDTQGGDREVDSLLQLNGDKVTGKWGLGVGGKNDGSDVAGTYIEKKLSLDFAFDSPEVGPGTMKIKGTMADDGSLSGDWAFQDYSGTFKATRMKDDAPKADPPK